MVIKISPLIVTRILCIFFLSITLLSTVPESSYGANEEIEGLKRIAKRYYWGNGPKKNLAKALQLYLRAAALGDADAQFISGGMYYKGLGVEKNLPEAFRYLYMAAENGRSSAKSEKIIAESYMTGLGTLKNYDEAIRWYTIAAEHGSAEAKNSLGYIYYLGNGVEQDTAEAATYFLAAATDGLAVAQYNVGILYYTGRGFGVTDIVKSYSWMNLAAGNGHQPAIPARDYLETVLSTEELTMAQEYSKKNSPPES